MQIIYGINNIRKFKHPVVALGVFDGVHRGHREILRCAVKEARRIGGRSIALTFWPHPQREASLYSIEHRLRLIAELGLDACIVARFNRAFSGISADDFISKILVKKIGAACVCVGKNFRFGRSALGDYKKLASAAKEYGFRLKGLKVIRSGRHALSSTIIRKLIRGGKIKEAQGLLGRQVSVLGSVIKGSSLGRVLGIPTANIDPHHEIIPPPGIYAVRIFLDGRIYGGACYIGTRPTIRSGNKTMRIEVHIFGFNKDIYGRFLEIRFIKLIRPDKRFPSLNGLSAQMKRDLLSCRSILKGRS